MTARSIMVVAAVALVAIGCSTGDPASGAPTSTPDPTPDATSATTGSVSPATSSAPPSTTAAPATARSKISPPQASTVTDLLALERPIVIAHAGGDFEAPHSTMHAFTQAALAGADVLEMDVMLTADGVLVVQHDDTVDRTTEATGRVGALGYAELAALDNAHWYSGGVWSDHGLAPERYPLRGVRTGDRTPPPGYGPDDFRVETFRSIATAFPDHVLDVELKVPTDATGAPDVSRAIEGAQVLAAEIDELDRTDSVVVVSFDADVVAAFHTLAPDVATSPGLTTLVTWYSAGAATFAPTDVIIQVPPFFQGVEVLTAEVIARARGEGFDVWVWMDDTATQENPAFYAEMVSRGVDGLLVSRPAEAVAGLAAAD